MESYLLVLLRLGDEFYVNTLQIIRRSIEEMGEGRFRVGDSSQ